MGRPISVLFVVVALMGGCSGGGGGGGPGGSGGGSGGGGGGVSDAATTDGHSDGAADGGTGAGGGSGGAGAQDGGVGGTGGAGGTAGGGGAGAGGAGSGGCGVGGNWWFAQSDPVAVSSSFYLEQPAPAAAGSGDFSSPSMACASNGCLIVYAQTIGFRPMVVGTRVSASGAVLGRIALTKLDDVNASIGRVMVASNGSDYLVYANYTATVDDSPTPIHKFQIVDTAGAVSAESTTVFSGTPPAEARVYGGGANYLVLFATSLGPETTMLVSSQLTQVGAVTSTFTSLPPFNVIAGPGEYLFVTNNAAMRVSDTTGAAVGGQQSFWRYGNPAGTPVGFYAASAGNYYILGTRPSASFSYDTFGIRIHASDGQLLDPDDDFNQRSGGLLLCQGCYPGVQSADLVAGAGFATVDGGAATAGFRFTLSPFARVGAVGTTDVSLGAHAPTLIEPAGASNLLALEGGALHAYAVTASPFALNYVGQTIGVPRTPDVSEVAVAYAGTRFLVAGSNMPPTFLLDERGTLAPVAGLGPGGQVAANTTDFLLTQQQSNQVVARRIAADGTVGASQTWAYDPTPYGSQFRLTSNDRYYLLTAVGGNAQGSTTISGVRIGADGNFVDGGQGLLNGAGYAVAADRAPPPEMRTFGVFAFNGNNIGGGQWLRLRSETGVKISPLSSLPVSSYDQSFASDGTNFVDFYGYPGGAAVLLPGPGGTGLSLGLPQLPGGARIRGAWWDGRSYMIGLVYQDVNAGDPNARFTVARYSQGVELLDLDHADGRDIIPDKFHPGMDTAPAMASDGWGRSLIAYLYADPLYGGVTVKGVIVRNTGYRSGLVATATCTTGDSFDFGGLHMVEGGGVGTDPATCDPSIGGYNAPDQQQTDLYFMRNYLTELGEPTPKHWEYSFLSLFGPVPTSFPARYTLPDDGSATPGSARFGFGTNDNRVVCDALTGTVTITAFGPAGSLITGSYAGVTWDGINCPGTASGSFSVTREADH